MDDSRPARGQQDARQKRAREPGSLPLLGRLVSRGSPQHRGLPGGFILVEAESRSPLDFSSSLLPIEVHHTLDTTYLSWWTPVAGTRETQAIPPGNLL